MKKLKKIHSTSSSILKNYKEYLILIALIFIVVLLAFFPNPKSIYNPNPSPSVKASPKASITPSASPSSKPKYLKKETIRRENPDKTLAFYYTSDVPAFSSSEKGYEDDPFKISINGDTKYFTRGIAVKYDIKDTIIIKPVIINLNSKSQKELMSIDRSTISGFGSKSIIQWINSELLLSKDCREPVCIFDLVNVTTDTSKRYAANMGYPGPSHLTDILVRQVGDYYFEQISDSFISGSTKPPTKIKIYKIHSDELFQDLSSYTPIIELQTNKYLDGIIFDAFNVTNLYKKVQLNLSAIRDSSDSKTIEPEYGKIIFDLETGSIVEANNL